jgi:hypothetical protein
MTLAADLSWRRLRRAQMQKARPKPGSLLPGNPFTTGSGGCCVNSAREGPREGSWPRGHWVQRFEAGRSFDAVGAFETAPLLIARNWPVSPSDWPRLKSQMSGFGTGCPHGRHLPQTIETWEARYGQHNAPHHHSHRAGTCRWWLVRAGTLVLVCELPRWGGPPWLADPSPGAGPCSPARPWRRFRAFQFVLPGTFTLLAALHH